MTKKKRGKNKHHCYPKKDSRHNREIKVIDAEAHRRWHYLVSDKNPREAVRYIYCAQLYANRIGTHIIGGDKMKKLSEEFDPFMSRENNWRDYFFQHYFSHGYGNELLSGKNN